MLICIDNETNKHVHVILYTDEKFKNLVVLKMQGKGLIYESERKS